jgi:TonB family protein
MQQYQQSIWGHMDRTLRNCFTGAAILGLAALIAILVAPAPPSQTEILEQVPERLARLILEKPKPAAPPLKTPEVGVVETPKVEPKPIPKPVPQTPPRARTSQPKVPENKGVEGRQRAQTEVAQNLAQVTGSLDKVLGDLAKSLPASETSKTDDKTNSGRRRRTVRSGRTSGQLSSVADIPGTATPDVSTSAIDRQGISIAAISDLAVEGGGEGGIPGGTGATGGSQATGSEYRSNESLLGVVRRYAPGIQFCYDNELKKNPGLRGKLVVSITVLASGEVSAVSIVDDSLHSPAVTQCILAQIRGWRFPPISHGVTSFKSPFVFTPPK